jgi:hypothetical protein
MIVNRPMAKRSLTIKDEFVVGEAKVLNYVLACLFLALFLYGLTDAVQRNFKNIDYQSYVFVLALLPAVYCLRRAQRKRIYIRINKTGIYQDEQLVTPWSGFIKAHITQKEKTKLINLMDNFLLQVEYKKDGRGFRRQIPLTNTQNRSEEEVLQAVEFFWKQYQKTAGPA